MKAEIKANWIAALRSGEFKQTTGILRRLDPLGDSHCCLGVLACVANLEIARDGSAIITGGQLNDYRPIDDLLGDQPMFDALEMSGYKRPAMEMLYSINDGGKHSFPEIADWIEKNIEVTE